MNFEEIWKDYSDGAQGVVSLLFTLLPLLALPQNSHFPNFLDINLFFYKILFAWNFREFYIKFFFIISLHSLKTVPSVLKIFNKISFKFLKIFFKNTSKFYTFFCQFLQNFFIIFSISSKKIPLKFSKLSKNFLQLFLQTY